MSKPLGMESLRERLAYALGHPYSVGGKVYPEFGDADRALKALGLYDLDAAVERGLRALAVAEAECNGWVHTYEGEEFDQLIAERMVLWRNEFKAGLNAALTATDSSRTPTETSET